VTLSSAKLAWPPPTVPLEVHTASQMIRPHPEANWHQEAERRASALRAEQERVAAHYTAMARQREEREAAEAQKHGNGPGHQVGS
jgi:hypothetical protein